MKNLAFILLSLCAPFITSAQSTLGTYGHQSRSRATDSYSTLPSPGTQFNSGYTKQNGTVVDSYYSTKPDGTNLNNFSTQGNVNPHTGQLGTRARDFSPEANNYGQGRTIHEGPRGGQYYLNDQGTKTYVPKRKELSWPY